MLGFVLFLSLTGNITLLYLLIRQGFLRAEQEPDPNAENAILRRAMAAGGSITAIEIAAQTKLPLRLIEKTLRIMTAHNQCISTLDQEGRAVYIFPQFDDTTQKQAAIEQEILLMANLHGGELSAQQIAMKTPLTIDESRQWLLALADRGVCEPSEQHSNRFKFIGLRH